MVAPPFLLLWLDPPLFYNRGFFFSVFVVILFSCDPNLSTPPTVGFFSHTGHPLVLFYFPFRSSGVDGRFLLLSPHRLFTFPPLFPLLRSHTRRRLFPRDDDFPSSRVDLLRNPPFRRARAFLARGFMSPDRPSPHFRFMDFFFLKLKNENTPPRSTRRRSPGTGVCTSPPHHPPFAVFPPPPPL